MLTQDELSRAFYYEPCTGKLYRKERRGLREVGAPDSRREDRKKYLRLSYRNKNVYAHRVIWALAHGDIPEGMSIDHINGNGADNRLSNLRLTSHSENLKNSRLSRKNTSGALGVYWKKDVCKWVATIAINGKNKMIGAFDDIEAARLARKKADGLYGYHPNHGESRPFYGATE
jgi:hypothetical protein